jgi:hypothetical protein
MMITGGVVPSGQLAPNDRHPLARLPTDERNTLLGDVILRLASIRWLCSDKTQENQGDASWEPSPSVSEPTSA